MSKYTINDAVSYPQQPDVVQQAAVAAIEALGGKVDKKKTTSGHVEAKLDKKMRGKVIGDRNQLTLELQASDDGCQVALTAFPLDPIGRPLTFGARAGATRTAVDYFLEELNQRLG